MGLQMRAPRGPNLWVMPPEGEAKLRDLPDLPKQGKAGEEALQELRSLVGLEKVKELVWEIYAFADVQRRRQEAGLSSERVVLHMIFRGNPGTGKTTIARILGRLFVAAGLLDKGHVIEVERADLVGEYIGHTAARTKEQIKKAKGGILFIDEAYSLCRGGEKDFGKECIDCIVKGVEDNAKECVFILAGYPLEMKQLLRSNPGLRSRFPIQVDFPDYTPDELRRIALVMLKQRQYRLSTDAAALLGGIIEKKTLEETIPSNARMVRNLVEKAIRRQAVRLVREGSYARQDLLTVQGHELLEAAQGGI